MMFALYGKQIAPETTSMTSTASPRIGPVELQILQALDRRRERVWRAGDSIVRGLSRLQVNQSLQHLVDARLLERIERGVYLVNPRAGRTLVAPLELVGAWFKDEPYAVGGHAAAEYHRLTLDSSQVVEVQLLRKKAPVSFQGIRYVFTLAPRRRLVADNVRAPIGPATTTVVSPAKLVVQLLTNTAARRSQRPQRGAALAVDILRAGKSRNVWAGVDWARLVRRHGTASTARRLGFLLEELHIEGGESLLPLRGHATYVPMSPLYPEEGRIDTRWRLRINDPAVVR